jgi:fibronectin-binding autotransporter adhesin
MNYNGRDLSIGWVNYQVDTTIGAGTTVTLIGDCTYNGMTVSGSGTACELDIGTHTLTVGGNVQVDTAGIITIANEGTLNSAGFNVSIGNNGTLDTAGAVTCAALDASNPASTINNSGANTITASGNVTVSGTFTSPAASTITMGGAGTNIIAHDGVSPVMIGSLVIDPDAPDGTVSLGSDISLEGYLTIADAGDELNTGTYNLAVNWSAVINGTLDFSASEAADRLDFNGLLDVNGNLRCNTTGAGDIRAAGNVDFTDGIFTHGNNATSVFYFDGGIAQDFNPAGETFGNIEISGNNTDVTLQGTLTCNDLIISNTTGTTLDVVAYALSINGTFNNGGILRRHGSGTSLVPQDNNSGLVIYYGAGGNIENYTGYDYYDLEIEGGGTFNVTSPLMIYRDLEISGGFLNGNNQMRMLFQQFMAARPFIT